MEWCLQYNNLKEEKSPSVTKDCLKLKSNKASKLKTLSHKSQFPLASKGCQLQTGIRTDFSRIFCSQNTGGCLMNHISRAFEEHRNKSPKATFSPEILMLVTLYPGQPGNVWRYSEDTPTPGGQRLDILGSILKLLAPETGIMKPRGSKAYKEACYQSTTMEET